jgi:hypothetical protein
MLSGSRDQRPATSPGTTSEHRPPEHTEPSLIQEPSPASNRRDEIVAAIQQVQRADESWGAALQATQSAAPDAGFASRVRAIADPAEQEAAALELAASRNVGWTPDQNQRHIILSHELHPDANRPGPIELWERFDEAVERLGVTLEGVAMTAVARAFAELSSVAREIADDLDAGRYAAVRDAI